MLETKIEYVSQYMTTVSKWYHLEQTQLATQRIKLDNASSLHLQ